MQPLAGLLVVDLTRYLPGPFASRELLRLGARVVRVEAPEGDPLRTMAPAWEEALNAGKESVVIDLKVDGAFARALLQRADVVLVGFRPGVAARLGVSPGDVSATTVYCSITGFGDGAHAGRAGHDLNYMGWAGALADTEEAVPPVQAADLAAGGYAALTEILAALLERSRTGRGRHLVVSMTHGAHRLVSHRLGGDPTARMLTGGLACYRTYPTADGRFLTVAALETRFWRRLCELAGREDLADRQDDDDQEAVAAELGAALAARPLDEWLQLFDDEDVCAGPVWTLDEAARDFGDVEPLGSAAALGEHTERWRRELSGTR